MITIQICYDLRAEDMPILCLDDRIEDAIRPHCQDLELQGSGLGFGRRDLEFWATDIDPDISLEFVLEPIFLNTRNLEVNVFEEEHPDEA